MRRSYHRLRRLMSCEVMMQAPIRRRRRIAEVGQKSRCPRGTNGDAFLNIICRCGDIRASSSGAQVVHRTSRAIHDRLPVEIIIHERKLRHEVVRDVRVVLIILWKIARVVLILLLLASCRCASCGEHLGHERVLLLLTRIAHGWCSISQIRVRWYINNALESFGASFAVRVSAR